MPSSAWATFAGRNGVLLVGAPVGSRPFASQPPRAHTADCTAEPSELWSVRPDGSHPVDLGAGDDGIFSPGGSRLAVAYSGDPCWGYFDDVQGPDPAAGLFLSRSDGSHRHRIAGEGLAGWLPDGRLVDGTTSGNSLRLFEAETRRTVVRLQVPHLQAVSMSCSGRVAVTSAIRGGVELAVYTPERVRSSSSQQVTVVKQRVSVAAAQDGLDDPQWAPDGRTVLFERIDASGSGTLWRADVNGRHMRRLSPQHGADDSSGDWSPDGHRILFTRYRVVDPGTLTEHEEFAERVMNSNGSESRVIGALADGTQGTWSADARSVAFIAADGNSIRIVDATTGSERRRIPFGGSWLSDWQAHPGNHAVRCADSLPLLPEGLG